MNSKKSKKRSNPEPSYEQSKHACLQTRTSKYSFPKLPERLSMTKKYSSAEKELMNKALVNMHHVVGLHFDFWMEVIQFKLKCEEYVLEMLEDPVKSASKERTINKASFMILKIIKLQKRYILEYQTFRTTDGGFTGSVSSIKCCAGHAHGWDIITRLFSLESFLFGHLYHYTKRKYIQNIDLSTAEIDSLIHKDVCILLFDKKPIFQWSAKMVQLQLKTISQKWNHVRGISTNGVLRSAINKILYQLQFRLYILIENGVMDDDLQKPFDGPQEGIMSDNFKGKIICTPQNNCGMNSITSKNSWLTNLVLSMSRLITKIQNTMHLVDLVAPLEHVAHYQEMFKNSTPVGQKVSRKIITFEKIMFQETAGMLDNQQLQKMIVWGICPSIIGIDVLSRTGDVYGSATQDDYDFWSKSRNMAPTGVGIWMDNYMQEQNTEYILKSPLTDILYDLKEIAFFNAFELFSKKDGRNDMGFLNKFFVRIEHLQNIYDIVFKDMYELDIPFIMKIGADYVVSIMKKKIIISCDSAIVAIVLWTELLKRVNNWKINDINLKVIYNNLFKMTNLISTPESSGK